MLFEPNELSPRVQERRGPLRGGEEKEGRGEEGDGEEKGAVSVGAEEWGLCEKSSGWGERMGWEGEKEGGFDRARRGSRRLGG